MQNCLIVNRGHHLNKRKIKNLEKPFGNLDTVQNKSLVDFIPNKTYDLILVNWALKGLSVKDCRQLLFNLRKQLTFKRKLNKENGVIIVKEPVQRLDFEVPIQPLRLPQVLKDMVKHEFTVHHEESMQPEKDHKKDELIYFPKEVVFIGQWDPDTTPANKPKRCNSKFVDVKGEFKDLSPKMKEQGDELRSTTSKKLEGDKKAVLKLLSNAINKEVEKPGSQLNQEWKYHKGHHYGYDGPIKLGHLTPSDEKWWNQDEIPEGDLQ